MDSMAGITHRNSSQVISAFFVWIGKCLRNYVVNEVEKSSFRLRAPINSDMA